MFLRVSRSRNLDATSLVGWNPVQKSTQVKLCIWDTQKATARTFQHFSIFGYKFHLAQLTCPDLHVPADDPADRVGRDAPVHRAVYVLPVGGGGERLQDEGAVAEDSSHPGDVAHRRPVHRQPVDGGLGAARCGAVQPSAAGVGELET